MAELDRRKIVTKRRVTKVAKYQGGIAFTYGPLAYFLKNRIYVGEMHHGEKWFKGEHQAIIDRQIFDQVRELLKSNRVKRRIKHSQSGALLQGKLFDDKGNRMSPSFSSKNGVRYRFYVSTALRGRKQNAGSVPRISAPEIERLVEAEVRKQVEANDATEAFARVQRVTIASSKVQIVFADAKRSKRPIEIQWSPRPNSHAQIRHASSRAEGDLAASMCKFFACGASSSESPAPPE